MSFKLDKDGREVLDDTPVAIFVGELSSPLSMQEYVKRQFEFQKWKEELHNTFESDDDCLDFDVEIQNDLDDNTRYTENFFDHKILKDFKENVPNTVYNNSDTTLPSEKEIVKEEKKRRKIKYFYLARIVKTPLLYNKIYGERTSVSSLYQFIIILYKTIFYF